MERIKNAVERARAEREKRGKEPSAKDGPNLPSPKQAETLPAEQTAPSRSVPALDQNLPGNITYNKTSVVSLDTTHLEDNRIIALKKTDQRTIYFDRLRTQLLSTMKDNGWRTLAITSPTHHCGKTTVAVNLSFSIAHGTQQTVLLVDFDLRTPTISSYLGLPQQNSLHEYINDDCDLSDIFVNPGVPRLTILPNQTAVQNAAEVLMTTKIQTLVKDIRNRYESRLVVFDLPPPAYDR